MTFEKSHRSRMLIWFRPNKYARRIQFRQEWWCLTHNNDRSKSTSIKIAVLEIKTNCFPGESKKKPANKRWCVRDQNTDCFDRPASTTEMNCFYGQCAKLHFQHNHIHHRFFFLSLGFVGWFGRKSIWKTTIFKVKRKYGFLLWWWYSSYSRIWRLC